MTTPQRLCALLALVVPVSSISTARPLPFLYATRMHGTAAHQGRCHSPIAPRACKLICSDDSGQGANSGMKMLGKAAGTLYLVQIVVVVLVNILGRAGVISPPPLNTFTDMANAAMDAEVEAGRLQPLFATAWSVSFWLDLISQYNAMGVDRTEFLLVYCSDPAHATMCDVVSSSVPLL